MFAQAVNFIAVFYDGLVVPGALLLLASGTWFIVEYHGGWSLAFLDTPWLAGMVILFAFEFIEGNTITRLYFMRMRRLTRIALAEGKVTDELARARAEQLASFTHFLDIPLLVVIVSLGALRPMDLDAIRCRNDNCRRSGNSHEHHDPAPVPLGSGNVARN